MFYGPSYFTRWANAYGMKPLRECLLGKSGKQCCINRGFGSSCSEHQLYYYPRMIKPLAPKVLVYSCHGNYDAFGYSIEECIELGQRVIEYTQTDFPYCRIYIMGALPGHNMDENAIKQREEFNIQMKAYCDINGKGVFMNPMLEKELWDNDIFVDHVHFNQKGYDLFTEYFKNALKDELDKF